MNATQWKATAQDRLRRFASEAERWASGLLYGGLAASAVFPLVEAAGGALATGNIGLALQVGSLAGSLVGGNLLAEQISRWHGRNEAEISAELAASAQSDPAWRDALDRLLLELEAPRIVQAVLPERDWDRFQRMLQSELEKLGNSQKYADTVLYDQRGQTVGGNQQIISGTVNGPAVAGNVEQIGDRNYYEAPPDPALARTATAKERYLQATHRRCNVLPLAPLGGEESAGDDITLEQVYIALDTQNRRKLTDEEKAEVKKRQGQVNDDAERPVSVLEAAARSRRLVLLGDPGSGKSTFVRQLCAWHSLALLGQPLPLALPPEWLGQLLPLFTVIREVAGELAALKLDGLSLEEQDRRLVAVLWAKWRAGLTHDRAGDFADELADRLEAGEALVVLDGLDEAPVEQRTAVVRAIAALQRRYPHLARLIVTCRVRSYTEAVHLAGFGVETLAPFDPQKIQNFVSAWYGAQARLGRFDRATADTRIDDLAQAALSDDLDELSPNPMLLTTMAIVHQKETKLPKERVKLYHKAVEVLAARWQSHRGMSPAPGLAALFADENRLRRVLERLAYEAHLTKQKEADLPRSRLLTILEEPEFLGDAGLASAFLDYVDQRAGLLVGQGGDGSRRHPQSYSFPHRTFQEYLAGCYLIGGRGVRRAYWEKVAEGDYWYLAGMYGAEELLQNRRSEQTLLDLAYDLCPSAAPTDERSWRALVWSGQMAALLGAEAIRRDTAGPEGGPAYLARVKGGLVALLEASHLTPIERAEGGRALGLLGDPRPGVDVVVKTGLPDTGLPDTGLPDTGLPDTGLPDIDWIPIPVGPFVMGSEKAVDSLAFDDETPQFTCRLITEAYRIARYPVTVAQYAPFVQVGGYGEKRWWTNAGWAWRQENDVAEPKRYREIFQTPNHPVVGVSWYEAVAYCAWLSEQAGYVVTLPTESQWERAARHTDGRVYPWNREFAAERCNMYQTGIGATSAVGTFPQGNAECGAADMSGNVWEWCRSVWRENYEEYAKSVLDDLTDESLRVVRGGSWGNNDDDVRCAYRGRFSPNNRYDSLGFRLLAPGF